MNGWRALSKAFATRRGAVLNRLLILNVVTLSAGFAVVTGRPMVTAAYSRGVFRELGCDHRDLRQWQRSHLQRNPQ
jgi:hypothetical protein